MKKIILLAFAVLCLAATASAAAVTAERTVLYTEPSIAGKFVAALFKDNEVKILGEKKCTEKNAGLALASLPVTVADLDQKARAIILEKGHTEQINLLEGTIVEIIEEEYYYCRCRVALGGRGYYAYNFPKDKIRKLYGSLWYKIEAGGQTGYVPASDIRP